MECTLRIIFCRDMNNGNIKLINLSAIWSACHDHLRPFKDHLPLQSDQLRSCSVCSGAAAFHVCAHLRFGETNWVEEAKVLYCPDCDNFMLEETELSDIHLKQPELSKQPITAVEAKLWFDQPTFLNIEPTTRCNFNCWYCIGRHMKQEDINVENFAKVLDNFPTVKTIALVGEGEPLLHKGFFSMAHMAKDHGVRVMIISNGSAFSQSVIKKLCAAEIAYIAVSIDSADADTFASSRIDGELTKIWQGIERLCRYRDENGYKYPRIAVKGTLFSHTKNELPSIIEEAKRHGVDIFESFQPLNPMSTYTPIYPKDKLVELSQLDQVTAAISKDSGAAASSLQSINEFCIKEGIEIDKSGRQNGIRKNCDEQWIYSLLSGDVTPCCQIKTPIDPLWNLFDHSLTDILHEPYYQNTRFNLWNGLFPKYCEGCWKIG